MKAPCTSSTHGTKQSRQDSSQTPASGENLETQARRTKLTPFSPWEWLAWTGSSTSPTTSWWESFFSVSSSVWLENPWPSQMRTGQPTSTRFNVRWTSSQASWLLQVQDLKSSQHQPEQTVSSQPPKNSRDRITRSSTRIRRLTIWTIKSLSWRNLLFRVKRRRRINEKNIFYY